MKKVCFIMCILTFVFVSNVLAQWNIQTVDNSGDTGKWSDIAYDSQGNPHIVYYDATEHALMYSCWTGQGWEITSLHDPSGYSRTGEYCSIAIDQFDKPHISCYTYHYYTSYTQRGYLVYITKDDSGEWITTDVNAVWDIFVGLYTSINVTYNTTWQQVVPHIAYYRETGGDLYYAFLDPQTSTWIIMPVDTGSDVGKWTDIAADSDDNIYISYYDSEDKDLKIAIYDGNSWSCSIIDGLYTDVGKMTSIVIDDNDIPHVTYYDETSGALKHAELTISK